LREICDLAMVDMRCLSASGHYSEHNEENNTKRKQEMGTVSWHDDAWHVIFRDNGKRSWSCHVNLQL